MNYEVPSIKDLLVSRVGLSILYAAEIVCFYIINLLTIFNENVLDKCSYQIRTYSTMILYL